MASSEKHSTYAQRVRVHFRVPRGADSADLAIRAGDGAGWVRIDDVRVVPATPPERSGAVAYWDFEDVDQGWGPFYRGGDANLSDATTHLAERHAPYTNAAGTGRSSTTCCTVSGR
jgi:endo-alpha-N-acetylgalactosaminidase